MEEKRHCDVFFFSLFFIIGMGKQSQFYTSFVSMFLFLDDREDK